jgi:hypothetical protein
LCRAGGHEPTLHPPDVDVKPPPLAT